MTAAQVRRLCLDDRVGRSDRFVEAEADGRVYVFDIERGDCYNFNEVGSRIWALIAAPARVADVCAALVAEFAVDAETCEREVLDLMDEMQSARLIRILD